VISQARSEQRFERSLATGLQRHSNGGYLEATMAFGLF
jgi:hypothetical protein